MKRKRQITLEIEETTFFKINRNLRGFCPHCRTLVDVQPLENLKTFSNPDESATAEIRCLATAQDDIEKV